MSNVQNLSKPVLSHAYDEAVKRKREVIPPTADAMLANDFLTDYPIGSSVTRDDFDTWVVLHGVGTYDFVPDPKSIEWVDFTNQRSLARYRLTRASRALETPFEITVGKFGQSYKVLASNEAFSRRAVTLPQQVASLVKTKRKRLEQLLESNDLSKLSESGRIQAKMLAKAIDSYARKQAFEAGELEIQFADLRAEVERTALESPGSNGGFTAMLTHEKDDSDVD